MICIHVIPVGGAEPIHRGDESCFCQPLKDELHGLMIHHAQDLREVRERHGWARPNEKWLVVNVLAHGDPQNS